MLYALLNPSSASGKALRNLSPIEHTFSRFGIDYRLIITESEKHLRSVAVEGARMGYPVVCIGGDSTFSIAVDAVFRAKKSVPMAMIGFGSSNDITRSIGWTSIESVCRAISGNHIDTIDILRLDSNHIALRYFPGQLNIGLGAYVNHHIEQLAQKNPVCKRHPFFPALLAIAKAYRSDAVPVHLQISTNSPSDASFDRSCHILLCTKIRYWASGMDFAPDIRPNDGRLAIVLIPPVSFFRLANLARQASQGRLYDTPGIELLWNNEVHFTTQTPVPLQIDGDILRDSDGKMRMLHRFSVRLLKRALRVFVTT